MFQEKKDVFDVLFKSVSEAVIVVNIEQQIIAINTSTEKIFGYTEEELINQPLEILIPKKYKPNHSSHVKSFIKEKDAIVASLSVF